MIGIIDNFDQNIVNYSVIYCRLMQMLQFVLGQQAYHLIYQFFQMHKRNVFSKETSVIKLKRIFCIEISN